MEEGRDGGRGVVVGGGQRSFGWRVRGKNPPGKGVWSGGAPSAAIRRGRLSLLWPWGARRVLGPRGVSCCPGHPPIGGAGGGWGANWVLFPPVSAMMISAAVRP